MYSEITGYRIKNLRSIVDSKDIAIHNLNILVGKNGTGKSTFMKFFQVLSQSLRSQKTVPLLFYGNEADFGSFEESISRKSSVKSIGFGFDFSIKNNNSKDIDTLNISYLKVFYEIEKKQEDIYSLKMTINLDDDKIIIYYFNNKIKNININNIDFSWSSSFFSVVLYNAIPQIIYKHNVDNDDNNDFVNVCNDKINESINSKNNYHSKLTIKSFFRLVYLPSLLFVVNKVLQELTQCIFYIGPLRYYPQRQYKMSDIDDSRIDQFGDNISHFINNFSETEENDFRQWTYKYFEFKLSKVNKSGIISIKIDQKDEESENLVDVGFGYSQLLPIILQLWRFKRQAETVSNNSVKCHCYIFLIEQPELHLHPAFQRRLLRAIVDIQNECKQNNVIIKVILETHSATIIDELGRITDEELLAPDDSIIYIFHKKNGISDISSAQYDSEGRLVNWPPGFFSGD